MEKEDDAPLPEDPERAEREVSTKFIRGLRLHENLGLKDLDDWQYAGGDWRT